MANEIIITTFGLVATFDAETLTWFAPTSEIVQEMLNELLPEGGYSPSDPQWYQTHADEVVKVMGGDSKVLHVADQARIVEGRVY